MSSFPYLDKKARIESAARKWVEGMDASTLGAFVDALVLGDYDWRDWFSDKPEPGFVNEAFKHAQYLEETR